MSIQKMARGPMMLIDREFTIPIFNAQGQMYVCTEVADAGSDSNGKKYGVYFKWLPTQFAVPATMRMDITIHTASPDRISVELYEKNIKSGAYTKLYAKMFDYTSIKSVNGIQTMIYKLIGVNLS